MSSLFHTPAPSLIGLPPLQACPLNACPISSGVLTSQQVWESFSQCFTPAVREVVEFAKSIPGFQGLSQHDQVMLLKAGTFQVPVSSFLEEFPLVKKSRATSHN